MSAATPLALRSTCPAGAPPTDVDSRDTLRMSSTDALLTADAVVDYLVSRGLVSDHGARPETLAGGVSNVVLAVHDGGRHLVVKQSLSRLRVADEWLAPQGRILTEADALELARTLVPGSAPALVDRDVARHAIVLEHAPPGWADWKTLLLAGRADAGVASRLGEVLATWHSETLDAKWLPPSFADAHAFELLRVDPYYRTTAERAPQVAAGMLAMTEEMARRRTCFVHGDLSPKNVLVDVASAGASSRCWVIDFEVAHHGDPAFDLAFMLCHLTMKSLHLPHHRARYDSCAAAFTDAYVATATAQLQPDWAYVLSHVGCLLLARVRGKSPAEYLGAEQRDKAWRVGERLLARPPRHVPHLHRLRDEVLG